MKKLLLPYAYTSLGESVYIENANKGENYFCPMCGKHLIPKQGKIRTHHFAHKKGEDNHCSESYLHKMFKENSASFIQDKISNSEGFLFEWDCKRCGEKHQGDLLKEVVDVCLEYNLGVCKPDIALLDRDGRVIIVIEIVVTHKPEEQVMQYCYDNKIICLQINVEGFEECDRVEDKLSHPNFVNMCPNPICEKCGKTMNMTDIDITKIKKSKTHLVHNVGDACVDIKDKTLYHCRYCVLLHNGGIPLRTYLEEWEITPSSTDTTKYPGLADRMWAYREEVRMCKQCGCRMKFRAGSGILDFYCYRCKTLEIVEILN